MDSDIDDRPRIYGQLWYLYLNENDSKRNLNVNQNNPDNNWNDNVRFLAVCKYLLDSPVIKSGGIIL